MTIKVILGAQWGKFFFLVLPFASSCGVLVIPYIEIGVIRCGDNIHDGRMLT